MPCYLDCLVLVSVTEGFTQLLLLLIACHVMFHVVCVTTDLQRTALLVSLTRPRPLPRGLALASRTIPLPPQQLFAWNATIHV